MNEIHIMVAFDHPFIAQLHTVFQDESYLYFCLELLQGGELFTHTRKFYKLEESWAKFYSASVILAFTQIHAHHVAYRDLKPENLVMNSKGCVRERSEWSRKPRAACASKNAARNSLPAAQNAL